MNATRLSVTMKEVGLIQVNLFICYRMLPKTAGPIERNSAPIRPGYRCATGAIAAIGDYQ